MRSWFIRFPGVAAICLACLAVPARADTDWIVANIGNTLQPNVGWEQVRSHMLARFYGSNPGDRGVTPEGIDNLRKIAMAQRRSQSIAQLLPYDLDANGEITKEEITTVLEPRSRQMIHANGVQLEPTQQQIRAQLDKLVSDALKPDADRNGVISAAEIEQEAQRQADQVGMGWRQGNASHFIPMTLDSNGDGAVSLAEYETAVRQQFDMVDEDRDGRISNDEAAAFSKRLNEARQNAQRAREAEARKQRLQAASKGCDVPAAPSGTKIVVLGAQTARALSNAWIGTQDKVTYVTTVEIAPGPEPLYLALASGGAMVWDIVGATERISGVVAHADATVDGNKQGKGKPLVGILGVPREKIHFTAHPGCLVPANEQTMKDGSAEESATLLLGRVADEIGGEYSAGTFRVPATRHFPDRRVRNFIQTPTDSLGELLWREVRENFSAGIAQIDAGAVISAHAVKHYAILPDRAGLAELVDAGSLTVIGTSRILRLNRTDAKPYTQADKFRIFGKLRLPAGVTGTFILPRQMPPPEGDFSTACVLSEEDMKPIRGSRGGCT